MRCKIGRFLILMAQFIEDEGISEERGWYDKLAEMEQDPLVLCIHTLKDLQDDCILVVQMLHDVADFLFTLDVAVVIALGHQAIFRSLAVLGHHHERGRICRLETQGQIQ